MRGFTAAMGIVALAATGCPKATTTGSTGTDCTTVLTCLSECADQACADECENGASNTALTELSALSDCVNAACPDTPGSTCATDTSACDTCLGETEAPGGTCGQQFTACDPTGDTGGPTGNLGCGGVNNCLNACASTDTTCQQDCFDQGTTTGQTLFAAFNDCLASACPETTGGICATETADCDNCILTSEAQSGQCNSSLVACDGDTSGSGSVPAPSGGSGCLALSTCLNACAANDATCENACVAASDTAAPELLETLDNCLFETACPTTAGGLCYTDTMACELCLSSAELMGAACYTPYEACASG